MLHLLYKGSYEREYEYRMAHLSTSILDDCNLYRSFLSNPVPDIVIERIVIIDQRL